MMNAISDPRVEGLEIFGIEELEARQELALLTVFAQNGESNEQAGSVGPTGNSVKGCAIFGLFSFDR